MARSGIRSIAPKQKLVRKISKKPTRDAETGELPLFHAGSGEKGIAKKRKSAARRKGADTGKSNPKVPYHRKPDEMSLEQWQKALRKQFAEIKTFRIEKLGSEPVFCDYMVTNTENGNSYKISLRDNLYSMNFCECLDFKTNQLGTCKHIEAVIRMIERSPKLKKIYKTAHNPDYTSVYLSYRVADGMAGEANWRFHRQIRVRIGERKKLAFKRLAENFFDSDLALKPESYGNFEEFLKQASAIDSGFRCYPDALSHVLRLRDYLRRVELIDQMGNLSASEDTFDSLLRTKLFRYQKEGVRFAFSTGRSLIADDMGLGKTIQAIATAELMNRFLHIGSVLIVCPTSLKYQWKSEIKKFTGNDALIVEGNALVRSQLYEDASLYKIVSYHALVNDLDEIGQMSPDLVILDEAQRIKNFRTKVAQSVKRISSPYAIVLTGTPLENKLEELYSIVSFVDPYLLGPYYRFLSDHRITDDKGKVTGYKGLNEIGQTLSSIMIRRKKPEVLDQLPERMDKTLLVDVTARQAQLHEEFASAAARIVARWRVTGHLSEQDRQRLLILLNQMRMVCDSTYILDQQSRDDTKIDEIMSIIGEVVSEGDEKLVIFSQWERMTRLVASELSAQGIGYEYLHGGVPSAQRGQLFERFSNDQGCRVFLSTDAGGVGLNLQAGSVVINLDIPWNPAILEQRIARVHRLGQKRKVSVINMVSAGTIEHRMLDVLKFKSSMSAGILDGGEDVIFMEESRFRKFMASVEDLVTGENKTSPVVHQHDPEEQEAELKRADTELPSSDVSVPPAGTQVSGEADKAGEISPKPLPADPAVLITKGIDFLQTLVATLAQPGAVQQLTDSITHTDPADGKTYLKLPVESKKTVEQLLGIVAGLFGKGG